MNTAKHTPEPWTIEAVYIGQARINFGEYRFPQQADPGGRGHSREYPREEAEANARLMGAAPELLAALKRAHQYLFSEDGPDEVDRGELATEIEAAIAKAEGK
jgi:hypothetical protein